MAKRQQDETSRAEQVRARRQQSQKESQVQPFGSSASRKRTSAQVPVTLRKVSPVPMVKRQGHKVNVPLKSKGAELQLPAFPKIRLGWRLISGAIFILSLTVLITFTSLDAFKVNAITLRGADRLTEEMVLSQIGISGSSIVTIQPDEIETRLSESFPGVSSVKVSAGLPSSVTVSVVERQPLIAWQQASGTLWIDSEGVMFPASSDDGEVSLTVIAVGDPPAALSVAIESPTEDIIDEEMIPGGSTYPRTTPEFVQGVLALREYVPEGKMLQYDPQYGLGWRDPKGWLVYFGKDTADIDLKLAEYQTIIGRLGVENLTPALISLEYLHAPYYRLEQ